MARDFFRFEKGIHFNTQDEPTGVHHLFGSAIPGLLAQEDDAEQGSIYQRTNGELWIKILGGTGTDKWARFLTSINAFAFNWRQEIVRALTADASPGEGGTIDLGASPFSDDASPFLTGSDFALGEAVLFGSGGTEVIARITNIAGDVLTFTEDPDHATYPIPALTGNDSFVVYNYLPDGPDSQEKQAIVLYDGSNYVKVGDFNWDLADGINIGVTYSSTGVNGNISSGDTVESSLEKLEGNQQDLTTLSGESQGAIDHGAFTQTDTVISSNETTKGALQDLVDYVDRRVLAKVSADAVTTAVTLDSVLVDQVVACKWIVAVQLDSDSARRQYYEVNGLHNGTISADATATDDNVISKLKVGANFANNVSVDISGSGATQVMRLRVSSNGGGAVSYRATRYEVDFIL